MPSVHAPIHKICDFPDGLYGFFHLRQEQRKVMRHARVDAERHGDAVRGCLFGQF